MTNDTLDDTEKDDEEETVLALLENATKPLESSPNSVLSRRAFEQRLATFRPFTYFAKPAIISPLVCARFGWTNPSQDIIVCRQCKAVVAIAFHPLLSKKEEDCISEKYKDKLCTAHSVACVFHANEFPPSGNTMIPSYLGSVLPVEIMQLFEQPNPKGLLEKRIHVLLNTVGKERQPLIGLPQKQIEEFLPENESVEMFISRICEALGCNEWAALLALLCWQPHTNSEQSVMLSCPICLAQCELCFQPNDGTANDRPSKKRKTETINPMTSHRHYCPVICGFPTSPSKEEEEEPMWRVVATNLLKQATDKNVDFINGKDVMLNIHRLLRLRK